MKHSTILKIILLTQLAVSASYGTQETRSLVPKTKAIGRCLQKIANSGMEDKEKISEIGLCLEHFGPRTSLYAKAMKFNEEDIEIECRAQVLVTGKVMANILVSSQKHKRISFSALLVFKDENGHEIHREAIRDRTVDMTTANDRKHLQIKEELRIPPSVAKRISDMKILPSIGINRCDTMNGCEIM